MSAAHEQRGIALAIVVWFIAGMSLLVAGIVADAKVDTKMAQLHYFRAQATAAGDGAINLAIAEQYSRKTAGQPGMQRLSNVQVGQFDVEVRVLPSGALVDISSAPAPQLRALFARVEADSAPGAGQLAAAVIRYRNGKGSYKPEFTSPEDLLRVPLLDRAVYDAVKDYITVAELGGGSTGGRGLGPNARMDSLEDALSGDGKAMQGVVEQGAETLRVDAVVDLGGQKWMRRRWVSFSSGEFSELPWQVVRSETARPLPQERQR